MVSFRPVLNVPCAMCHVPCAMCHVPCAEINSNCGRYERHAILIYRLLLRMRCMYVACIRLDFHLEWMECSLRTFGPSITHKLITRVLTICHMKLAQSTALEQQRFDLRSLSPTFNKLLVFTRRKILLRSWSLTLKLQEILKHAIYDKNTKILTSSLR